MSTAWLALLIGASQMIALLVAGFVAAAVIDKAGWFTDEIHVHITGYPDQ